MSKRTLALVILTGGILAATVSCNPGGSRTASSVKVWEEDIIIPTYLVGPPDPNPMFYFGRSSQGAEGRIYPYPLYDNLTEQKADRSYRIIYLENEYLKISILPEIGGRIFSGMDKTNGYDFFYRQHVIKPALIGLIGAWISGGMEWNIPHHHRATTFTPVQYCTEEHADGSRTVWLGELELRHRMRWVVGYTLRPGRSYLETSIRIVNRTPVVHSMLAFANVAVHANEEYQIIFPPSTQHVTHHSKRQFTTWPIATTPYGGADFSTGVDVSWYRNHHHSCSMFAWNYEDDFFAGYDHGRQAGTMSVADHNVVPGKKFWTWGTGPSGRMWDAILTDDDGPYVELMTGAYSDNQPDYSWLQPCDTRAVKVYWYPFRDIGGVKNANRDAAVNLELIDEETARVGFYTTAAHRAATVELIAGEQVLLREEISIDPAVPYVGEISVPAGVDRHDLRASLSIDRRELVAYSTVRLAPEPMPPVVTAPPPPAEIGSIEELFLAGQRIDQFHHPTLEPEPYWREALRRDPGDSRVNTAMGILALRRARFEDAERYFRTAVSRLTAQYTAPKDTEPLYYLGVALKARGRYTEAFDAFAGANWSSQWLTAASYAQAELSTLNGEFASALNHLDRSLDAGARNLRALTLKAAVLRHLGRSREALKVLDTAGQIDPLDVRTMTEHWLVTGERRARQALAATLLDHPATALETAAEYMNAGLWEDGTAVLELMTSSAGEASSISPLVSYYLGFFAEQTGEERRAREHYQRAMQSPPDYVFPFQYEVITVLRRAIEVQPEDARARYYLGNLLFDLQPEEAVRLWEESATLDPSFPIVHRNLAMAFSHTDDEALLARAIRCLETAVALPDPYPMHFAELDRLYETAGIPIEQRLALLERNRTAVIRRDDAAGRAVGLMILTGRVDEAIALMTGRVFDIWEEGARFNVGDAWTDAYLLRGRQRLAAGRPHEARTDFEASLRIPDNLRVPEIEGIAPRQAEVLYWIGEAYAASGDPERARATWQEAAALSPPPSRRVGEISEQRGIQLYHQALALMQLGQKEQSTAIFRDLEAAGEAAVRRAFPRDRSSTSVRERRTRQIRIASGHYLAGLGLLGLGEEEPALERFRRALEASPDHLGARTVPFGPH